MPYLLRAGAGKGIAIYTRCEDVLLAEAELLVLKEDVEKNSQYDGKPIYGYIDVDNTLTISEFKESYRGDYVRYRRLMDFRKMLLTEGWNYPTIEL